VFDFGDASLLEMAGKEPVPTFVQFIFPQQFQKISVGELAAQSFLIADS
jgi:hypothetical protein